MTLVLQIVAALLLVQLIGALVYTVSVLAMSWVSDAISRPSKNGTRLSIKIYYHPHSKKPVSASVTVAIGGDAYTGSCRIRNNKVVSVKGIPDNQIGYVARQVNDELKYSNA